MGMSPVRRAFVILFAAAFIVAVLLLLAQDQQTLKIRSAVSAEDARHPSYLAALLGASLTRGNHYTVLTNGDQIFPAQLAAIEGAKRRISFETYVYNDGEVAEEFTRAFEHAARRGVKVQMVLDAVGASGISKDHLERLKAAGCTIGSFNAPAWYSLEELNYRTHRKLLIVDGALAYTGGVGIADYWLGNAQDEDHWRDTQVEVRGPVARLLEAAFYENYLEVEPGVAPELDDELPAHDEEGASLIVRSSPTGGTNDLKRLYLLGIAAAGKTIDITTPYFVPDESVMWSLQEARQRGVRIRLLVESDITDAMPVKYAGRNFYDRLLSMGVEIYEYQPTMMHAKTLVVDGIWSMFGSANFDNRSLELNEELNVAVTDRALAARFLEDFEQDLRASDRIELAEWRDRSLLMKSREKFWALFGEVF